MGNVRAKTPHNMRDLLCLHGFHNRLPLYFLLKRQFSGLTGAKILALVVVSFQRKMASLSLSFSDAEKTKHAAVTASGQKSLLKTITTSTYGVQVDKVVFTEGTSVQGSNVAGLQFICSFRKARKCSGRWGMGGH